MTGLVVWLSGNSFAGFDNFYLSYQKMQWFHTVYFGAQVLLILPDLFSIILWTLGQILQLKFTCISFERFKTQ